MNFPVLEVDLSSRSYGVTTLSGDILRRYIGGRGLGSYLLARYVPALTGPSAPENHLIFSAGPANGTGFFYSARSIVTTKSPLTGTYTYAVSSGTLCHQLRKAGFWALDIRGVADSPVYLAIDNEKVSFHDARELWGMEVSAAQEVMTSAITGGKAATAAIGRAGEMLFRQAAIMAEGDSYRAFGRGGCGCVMGSKHLKGIAIRGDGVVKAANEEALRAARQAVLANAKTNESWAAGRRANGTGADIGQMSQLGILPTRNWQSGQFEQWEDICVANVKVKRQDLPCAPFCPTPCSHRRAIEEGPYRGAHCDGPEYETIYVFGSNCGVNRFDAIVAAAQICDENGLDTMSAGAVIGFAMECFEKGLLSRVDTEGLELRFGNHEAMISALKKMVGKEGFGGRLALGVKRLSAEIRGSEAFAMHVKGLELGGYECRGLMGQALQCAINNRGGDHHAYGLPARTETADGTRMQVEGKGAYVRKAATGRMVRDSIPVCSFPGVVLTDKLLPDIVSALYGEVWTAEDLSRVALRIATQERLFNMREGMSRKDDTLPPRLLNEPTPDGPTKGSVVPLERLKDDYYRAMGWDLATGNPTDSFLDGLEIEHGGKAR